MVALPSSVGLQLLLPFGVMIAAAIKRTDRKLLARLRDARATTPDRALSLEELSGLAARRLRRLTDGGAVMATPDGRYFLDEGGWSFVRGGGGGPAFRAVAGAL